MAAHPLQLGSFLHLAIKLCIAWRISHSGSLHIWDEQWGIYSLQWAFSPYWDCRWRELSACWYLSIHWVLLCNILLSETVLEEVWGMHLPRFKMIVGHDLQLVHSTISILYFFESVVTKLNDPLNAFAPLSVAIIIFFVAFITWYTSALGILHLMFA